jgi:hypothetical protein
MAKKRMEGGDAQNSGSSSGFESNSIPLKRFWRKPMKKLLVLCAGLMLVASAASAQVNGLHMSWAACPNQVGHLPDGAFTCDGSLHSLYGTFNVAASTPGVVAMDGIIDLLFQSPGVPSFWQFQTGGCNETGVAISAAKPAAGCGTAANNTTTLCSAGGAGCSAFITAYAFGASINQPANRARMLIALARASTSPVTLANTLVLPNAHYAWNLNFFEDNASEIGGPCDGCGTGVSFTWNQAVFYNTSAMSGGEGVAAAVSSADVGSADASSFSNCTGCQTVGARNRSWGQLKSLYR